MSLQPDRRGSAGGTNARQSTALHGRWLLVARAMWIAMAILPLGYGVAGIWITYVAYPVVCNSDSWGASSPCISLPVVANVQLLEQHELLNLYLAYYLAFNVVYVLTFWAIAVLIFWKKSDDLVALLVSLALLTLGVANTIFSNTAFAAATNVPQGQHSVHFDIVRYADSTVTGVGFLLFGLSFYLFPDGRFVPRWTRWAAIGTVIFALKLAAGSSNYLMLSPFGTFSFGPWMSTEYGTFGHGGWVEDVIGYSGSVTALEAGLLSAMLFAQVYRFARVSEPLERQQNKWVVFGLMAPIVVYAVKPLAAAIFLELVPPGVTAGLLYGLVSMTVTIFSLLLVPLSFGVAILRYRLWDIDIIINRTLLYGALTISVIALYVLIVGGFGALFVGRFGALFLARDIPAVSWLATGVVALLFHPLRVRLQRGVNRLMYGERGEPYAVLSRLRERLEATIAPKAALSTIAETVAQALKLPYAAIALKRDGEEFVEVVEYGKKEAAVQPLVVPLTYQNERVGELLLAPRVPGEAFGNSDLRFLQDLSPHIGIVAHDVRLTADLQRSRARLVTAREEERRRLRRDLHDGVGPQLAALMLELETASELVSDNPEASAFIDKVSERAREAVADVRRSVHALRPPALDELGLVGALREVVGQYDRGRFRVSIEVPDELPPLPAAVEVACYRIAQEAITNVVRHAGACNCRVRIALDEEADMLDLEVEDDGRGITDVDKGGFGMSSMRERAEELGGNCAVVPSARGGTLVSALLPCRTTDGTDRKEG